ncbi:zinc-binding dehydrogenase [Paenibacillus sp. T1]|uniref:Zinc-binding dehydrogenase n=2 Tax=Paenibacillus glycinis TaxID=2697035 RepID=A0ABW9XYJ6_9BACL|nr:zinc-binding dehydrogenase [Paenibacillus glycinis]
MQAMRYHEFGAADVMRLEEVPRPEPQAGEVLVRVVAAGVLPADWKLRKGLFPMPVRFPVIPGTAFAGIVEETAPGVTDFRPGQAVFGRSPNGTYAEFAAVPAEAIAAKPPGIGFEEAAAVSGGATTAWRAIMDGEVKPGDRVLIHGAAGGVGLFAVQFAKWKGAHVVGTAGPANLDFIRSLGADAAVDYTAEPFENAAQDVDFVLDTIGGKTLERSWTVVKRGGALITITGRPPIEKGLETGVRIIKPSLASGDDLAAIAGLLEQGIVRAIVQRSYPLGEARLAQEQSESGHGRGRIVLRISEA